MNYLEDIPFRYLIVCPPCGKAILELPATYPGMTIEAYCSPACRIRDEAKQKLLRDQPVVETLRAMIPTRVDPLRNWLPRKRGLGQAVSVKEEDNMEPSIGRIVVYHHPGSADGKYPGAESPAIVQKVNEDGTLELCVFSVYGGLFFNHNVRAGNTGGCWWWPERGDASQ